MKIVWPGGRVSSTPSPSRWTSCPTAFRTKSVWTRQNMSAFFSNFVRQLHLFFFFFLLYLSQFSRSWPRKSLSRPWRRPLVRLHTRRQSMCSNPQWAPWWLTVAWRPELWCRMWLCDVTSCRRAWMMRCIIISVCVAGHNSHLNNSPAVCPVLGCQTLLKRKYNWTSIGWIK